MADSDRDESGFYTGEGQTTISLRTPVERTGAQPLTAITLKEPTAKQLSEFFQKANQTNDDGVAAMTLLISLCSGIPPNEVENLRQRDHDKCAAWLALFTKALPKSSATA
jgi:hypothetical protein